MAKRINNAAQQTLVEEMAPPIQETTPVRTSMLSGRKAYTPLVVGTTYHAVIVSYAEYEAKEELKTDKNLGFISFKLQLVEDGRIITDTRSVPVGTDIMSRQLLEQTKMPNAMEQEELFRACIDRKLPIELWITHNDEYTNYTYQKPAPEKPINPVVDQEDFK